MDKTKILIVGGGPAGIAAAKAASKNTDDIILCGEELHNPYWRTRLPSVIAHATDINKLNIVKDSWFDDNDVEFIPGKIMNKIDTSNNKVIWSDNSSTQYEKLILATGAKCFMPNINTDNRLYSLRSYEDALAIRQAALQKKSAVVIGGGLLGLEIAFEIKKLGVSVTVVELDDFLLSKQLDKAGGEYLANVLSDDMLNIITGTNINDRPELLENSCIVVAAGIKSNIQPLVDSEIEINRAVVVDEYMKTSVHNIYACGDLVEYNGDCLGLISVANMQGTVAGNNASGKTIKYNQVLQSPMLKIDKVSVMSIGIIDVDKDCTCLRYASEEKYMFFNIKNKAIIGAAFVGDISLGMKVKKVIQNADSVYKKNMSVEELINTLK